jgi:RHS repeat-associated protein
MTCSYQYDAIGNMRIKTEGSTSVMEYGLNAGPHAVTSAGGVTYTYDANGNMVIGKNKTLEYDVENRLIRSTEGSNISVFAYDGDGGRVSKCALTTNNQQLITYIGSLFEIDSSGTTRAHIFAGSQRVCTVSLRGPSQDPSVGAEAIFYHPDHLGSTNVTSDGAGNLVESCEYMPYGTRARNEVTTSPGHQVTSYLFTGKELDSTGLYYYGARYYDPDIGRFITADTIVQSPYDPQSLNRYSYCRNNPINYIDPTGHNWWKNIAGIVGAVVGTIVGIVTANPLLGMLLYSAIAASGQSGSYGRNFGINFASCLAGYVVGAAAGGIASNYFSGNFLPGLIGSAVGGAAGGAAASAMLGGDVGTGALAGFAGGMISYAGGSVWPLGADAVAGGVSSVIMGGDFGEGAAQGAYYNMAETAGGLIAPMPTAKQQNAQPGDIGVFKADGVFGVGIAFFEGGPFSHAKIMTDTGKWVSATPGRGVRYYSTSDYENRSAVILQTFRGNRSIINAAKQLTVANLGYGWFGQNRVCSTTVASAINKGGYRGWAGLGPNSVYRTFISYGE